jgi:hypothetical protein
MHPMSLIAMLLLVATAGHSLAEGAAPAPTSQSPAQTPRTATGLPPCATFEEQRAALGKKAPSGSERLAGQPAERSGILPSAGASATDPSAAPTMKEGGKEFRSPLDCPLVPEHPNAVQPGTTTLPKLSN